HQITENKTASLEVLTQAKTNANNEINTNKTQAITNINEAKTSAKNEISEVKKAIIIKTLIFLRLNKAC
ncbi:ATPase, partial [Helicobacter pylori]